MGHVLGAATCWVLMEQDESEAGPRVVDDEEGHLIYQAGDVLQARCTRLFVTFSLDYILHYSPCFTPFVGTTPSIGRLYIGPVWPFQ